MQLIATIPNVFYEDLSVGLHLFIDGLGFEISHDERPDNAFVVVKRNALKFHLVEDAEYAAKDRPEIRIETDDIDALYKEVADRAPDLLHPNLREVTLRPWNAKEFSLLDESNICLRIQQWV
ncbi:MAG: hypothetical protein AAF823_07960 [Planctomycetota bacterium]